MITKEFTPKRTVCKVTFHVPEDWAQKDIAVVGEFNDWDATANKMERKNGGWETVVRLKPETTTRFRYFIDGANWENDDQADDYVDNEHGSKDCVLVVGK